MVKNTTTVSNKTTKQKLVKSAKSSKKVSEKDFPTLHKNFIKNLIN